MKKAFVTASCLLLCACNATTGANQIEPDTPSDQSGPQAIAQQTEPPAPLAGPVLACKGEKFAVGEYALTITPSRKGNSLNFAVNIENRVNYPINWFRTVPPPLLLHAFKLTNSAGRSFTVSGQGELDAVNIQNQPIAPGKSLSGTVTFDVPRGDYTFIVEQIVGAGTTETTDTPILQCSTHRL